LTIVKNLSESTFFHHLWFSPPARGSRNRHLGKIEKG